MATKDSEFDPAEALSGSEVLVGLQSGWNRLFSLSALKSYFRKNPVTTLVSSGGVLTIDLSLGDYFYVELTENIAIDMINPPGSGFGMSKMVWIKQHASAAKTITWPAALKVAGGGGLDAISTTLGSLNLLSFSSHDNAVTCVSTLAADIS